MTDSRTPDRQEPTPQDTTEAALMTVVEALSIGVRVGRGCSWADIEYAKEKADRALSTIRSELERLREERDEEQVQRQDFQAALVAIVGPEDAGPWIEAYRARGGGYEGLQAIAEAALGKWAVTNLSTLDTQEDTG